MKKLSLSRRLTKCQLALTASLAAIVLGLANENVVFGQDAGIITSSEAISETSELIESESTLANHTTENTSEAIEESNPTSETTNENPKETNVTIVTESTNEAPIISAEALAQESPGVVESGEVPTTTISEETVAALAAEVTATSKSDSEKATALTVAEAKTKEKGETITIEAFIVGSLKSQGVYADPAVASNLVIADSIDAAAKDTFAIQLASGSTIRKQYNLIDNPDMKYKRVRVTNKLDSYFSAPGFKGTTVFELIETPSSEDPGVVQPPVDNPQTPETPTQPETPPTTTNPTIEEIRSSQLNQTYTTSGKIISNVGAWGGNGFYIQDQTGKGIYVYPGNNNNLGYKKGDSIQLTGKLGTYYGELQLATITNHTPVATITTPDVLTINIEEAATHNQATLVKFDKVNVGMITPDTHGNSTFNISNSAGSIIEVRVDSRSGVKAETLALKIGEGDIINLEGILSVYNGKLQIKPFDINQFTVVEKKEKTPEEVDAEKVLVGQVQGESHQSPLVNKVVSLRPTVVTHVKTANIFYVQDVQPDDNIKTSDGIEVQFNNHKLKPGDIVNIIGRVAEIIGDGYAEKNQTDLASTRIVASTVVKDGNMAVPDPIILGEDRKIPTVKVDSDGFAIFNPDTDAIDFWESLEGMLVAVRDPKVIGPQNYKEIYVLPGNYEGELNNAYGLSLSAESVNPDKIPLLLKNDFVAKSGDRFEGLLVGPVSYSYTNYKVLIDNLLTTKFIEGDLKPETTTLVTNEKKLLIAAYNIENFSANKAKTSDEKVARLAQSFVHDLKRPDIVSVVEMQDNNGETNDGVTDATESAKRLIDAIVSAGGPLYQYIDIAPVNNQDGGAAGANIRTGFLYNPERVKLADKPIAKNTEDVTWVNGSLSHAVGRIENSNPAWNSTRKPVIAEFDFNGDLVHVMAVHLNSKRGDDGIFGSVQPVVFGSETKRHELATMIANFLDEGQKQNPNLNIAVMGDFNDYEFTKTIDLVTGENRFDLVSQHDKADRYTYFYQGNFQTLDNMILSNNLRDKFEFDIVHVNSPFMEVHGRASDHDPLLVSLNFEKKETEEPTDPTTPGEPTDPATPEEPTDPATPEEPTDPATPEEPTDPATPEEPTDPATPEEPAKIEVHTDELSKVKVTLTGSDVNKGLKLVVRDNVSKNELGFELDEELKKNDHSLFEIYFVNSVGERTQISATATVVLPKDPMKVVAGIYYLATTGLAEALPYIELSPKFVQFDVTHFSLYTIAYVATNVTNPEDTTEPVNSSTPTVPTQPEETTTSENPTQTEETTDLSTETSQEISSKQSKDSQFKTSQKDVLPNTGEAHPIFTGAALAILAGLGLVTLTKNKEETEY